MLEKELIPKTQLKEEAEKEDFRYRADYNQNINKMSGRDLLQKEYQTILKGGLDKYRLKDYSGAELEFSKIIESDEANAAAYYYRGLIRNERQEYTTAADDFDMAFSYGFQEPDLNLQRGISNFHLKKYDKASSDFSAYLSLIPGDVEARFNKGLCESALKNFSQAISEFTKIIELNPNYELAYYERGKVFLKIENKEGACKDFRNAFKKGCLPAHHYLKTICNNPETDL
jgi:tetratricopeptide (TPR) repeat protein